MHREHQDAGLAVEPADVLDGVDAAAARHRDVHDDDVRPRILVASIGRRGVACLADDRQPVMLGKQRAIALAHDGVVVDKQDAHCLAAHGKRPSGASNGILASSLKPRPSRSATSSCPPSAITRSCMPIRPRPLPSRAPAAVGRAASVVLDGQFQPAPLGSFRLVRTNVECDARPARIGMLADIGQPFLDDPVDMRRHAWRQPVEVAVDLQHDLQLPAGHAVPARGRERRGWPPARNRRSPADAGSAASCAATSSWPSRSVERLFASGSSAGHSVSAVALIEAAAALMALKLCASSS